MNYQEFLDYIFQRYSGNVKLGLDRMIGILTDLSEPQNKLRGIHIGGTNGKGSACAVCEALAIAHGLHTGLNTSPHLIDYCERFRIDGINIEFAKILDVFHRYEEIFSRWDASFFEITTAIAFKIFAEKEVDTAVIEVGLGGRLDATNLFTPDVSVITTIGLDHVKTLGDSLEKIASEKAGIIKKGVPLVVGQIESSPRNIILDKAKELKSPYFLLNKDYIVSDVFNSPSGLSFSYTFGKYHFCGLQTNLLGSHQAVNISNGLTAFLVYCQQRNITPQEKRIREALNNINWMGRMQLLQTDPMVIVDGAHNQQGIETFVHNLKEMFPSQKLLFVVSILADKDYPSMLKTIFPIAKTIYISKNESDRAAEIAEQESVILGLGGACKTAPTVGEAFRQAISDAGSDDIIIGAGSLYTVAEIIKEQKNIDR